MKLPISLFKGPLARIFIVVLAKPKGYQAWGEYVGELDDGSWEPIRGYGSAPVVGGLSAEEKRERYPNVFQAPHWLEAAESAVSLQVTIEADACASVPNAEVC